jgi:PAS domain S-box-containing protein
MKTDYNTENLEKISEIFFSIAKQTGQLIFDGDAKTGKIGWYGAIEEFTGYTPEEFSKVDLEACKDLIHSEDLDRVWGALEKSLQTGEKFEQKFMFKRKNDYSYVELSSIFLKDANNYVYRGIGVFKDITERKHYQEKLRVSEESLIRYLQNFRGIGFQMDSNYNFVLLHGAVEEITGYKDKDFFSGKIHLVQLVDPEDLSDFLENRRKLSATTNSLVEQEYRIRNRSMDRIWVFESIQVVHNMDESNWLYQGFIQDINERKIATEALDKTEKLRKKEIHHRIKNNLQVISSLLNLECDNLLSTGVLDRERIIEAFRESNNRVLAMSIIHEELYNSRNVETINFASYLKKLTDDLFKSYKVGNSEIKLRLNLEDFFLEMDYSIPLGIIVNELVSNSLKYAFPDGRNGEIYIELQIVYDNNETLSNAIVESNIKNNLCSRKHLKLIVEDNGIGFPQSIDFKNTSSLGLQLVNTLVDQIGGEIESKKRPGTKFIILIPNYHMEIRKIN